MAAVAHHYPSQNDDFGAPVLANSLRSTDVEHDFFATPHAAEVSNKRPTKEELKSVANIPVLDEAGNERSFGSLWQREGESSRVLVIFVRHFFCGNCQEYLRTLSEAIQPDDLAKLSEPTSICVIGCGQPDLIEFYRQTTNCPYPIYAEPSRELYVRLGMARTMAPGEKKPDYVRKSILGIIKSGVSQGLTAGRNALKGGDFWQVGGEFFFENGKVTYCHRMATTRDHAEIPELQSWLGIGHNCDESHQSRTKSRRSRLSEIGASMRRSISRRRSGSDESANSGVAGPGRNATASRKGSNTSLSKDKKSMEKANE